MIARAKARMSRGILLTLLIGAPFGARSDDHATFCRLIGQRSIEAVDALVKGGSVSVNEPCPTDIAGSMLGAPRPLSVALKYRPLFGAKDTSLDLAELLLTAGAQINQSLPTGSTVFLYAFDDRPKNPEFLRFLELAGRFGADFKSAILPADPTMEVYERVEGPFDDRTGMTALMLLSASPSFESNYASAKRFEPATRESYEKMFDFVVSRSDLGAVDAYGRTALHHAVDGQSAAALEFLLKSGASRAARDGAGLTPFDYAISIGDRELMNLVALEAAGGAQPPVVEGAVGMLDTPVTATSPAHSDGELREEPVPVESTMVIAAEKATVELGNSQPLAQPTVTNDSKPTPALSIEESYAMALTAARQKKFQKARNIWEDLASKGHGPSQYQLGRTYARGDGVARNFAKARQLFEQARGTQPDANVGLAIMYMRGDGVVRDFAKAREYLVLAKEAGHPEADRLLANLP